MTLTDDDIEYLLSATDWIEDKHIKNLTAVKILSRLSALSLLGKPERKITEKEKIQFVYLEKTPKRDGEIDFRKI